LHLYITPILQGAAGETLSRLFFARDSPGNIENIMQSHVCIGGHHDGLDYPAHAEAETVTRPVGVTGRETYKRLKLSSGDASITVYVHEGVTPEQALNRLVEHYRAWCVNMPGNREA
jgi:hypothetical protein